MSWPVGHCMFCKPWPSKRKGQRCGFFAPTEWVACHPEQWLCNDHAQSVETKLAQWAGDRGQVFAAHQLDTIYLGRAAVGDGGRRHLEASALLKLGPDATVEDVEACRRDGHRHYRLRSPGGRRALPASQRQIQRSYSADDPMEADLQLRFAAQGGLQAAVKVAGWVVHDVGTLIRWLATLEAEGDHSDIRAELREIIDGRP